MTPIPLALYIHIPWCIRKCPYCDFNSHQSPNELPEGAYVDALLADLASEMPSIWGRRLESIFIGGGTPSLFSAPSIERLLCGIQALLPFRPNIEITLEANPGTFEQEKFRHFRQAGINRLSVGIQSFNDKHLKALGRVHNRAEALNVTQIARNAGFDNVNLDLMFGLPDQTIEQAMQDLQQAISLAPTHLSWYQLTLEPNTLFHKQPPILPDDDLIADIQQRGQALLADSDYQQYEVSAYSKAGFQCRHNRNYWEFGDYVAIGAGAHGKITQAHDFSIQRYQKYRQPADYMKKALEGTARSTQEFIAATEVNFEFMLNVLRLRDGFELALFTERTKLPVEQLEQGIQKGIEQGLLVRNGGHLKPTALGWRFLNQAIALFLGPK
ncbi:radical SAM family heme chaperone HemW [Thiolinea disciformis]|uniref:radical SAM family heme chaperone HemW n=1 Tax=Thiolinea disciformis TaxID=125614 RepID=UPI000369D566|nr:radical SAM family heme chaperone HemW [Thiolinea disciformis]